MGTVQFKAPLLKKISGGRHPKIIPGGTSGACFQTIHRWTAHWLHPSQHEVADNTQTENGQQYAILCLARFAEPLPDNKRTCHRGRHALPDRTSRLTTSHCAPSRWQLITNTTNRHVHHLISTKLHCAPSKCTLAQNYIVKVCLAHHDILGLRSF